MAGDCDHVVDGGSKGSDGYRCKAESIGKRLQSDYKDITRKLAGIVECCSLLLTHFSLLVTFFPPRKVGSSDSGCSCVSERSESQLAIDRLESSFTADRFDEEALAANLDRWKVLVASRRWRDLKPVV